MMNTDRYAYTSKLKSVNPMEKLIFALLTLVVGLWADSLPVSIAILLIMAFFSVVKGGTPLAHYLWLMLIPFSFLLVGVITVALEVTAEQQDFLLYSQVFGQNIGFTPSGLATALRLFFRAWAAVSCLYYLALTTPMVDILSALKKMRCPQLLIELMSLIYRFIFILLETAQTMIVAQNSRLGYINIRAAYHSLSAMLATLFVRAYKRSDDLYTALEARGYQGELKVLEEPYQRRRLGYLQTVVINSILVIMASILG